MDRDFTHISHLLSHTYLNKKAHPSINSPLKQIQGLRWLKGAQVSFQIYFISSTKPITEENTPVPISPKVNLLFGGNLLLNGRGLVVLKGSY